MQLELTPAEREFRSEVQQFLRDNLPAAVAQRVRRGLPVPKADVVNWVKALHRKGWAAPGWPTQFGGTTWSLMQRHIFDIECRAAQAPGYNGAGINMVGPAILKYGTEAQKQQFLPDTVAGDIWWCQGYSEPGAGSDLAGVATRATDDGDHYVVNGEKIWTSGAGTSDWIFALVRTDPDAKPQAGITFLLIDLRSPGVTVKPLYAFNGKELWSQVFFDDVRVPKAQRLGEENRGWTVAKTLLGDERFMLGRISENMRLLRQLDEIAAAELEGDSPLVDVPEFRRRMSELQIRFEAHEQTGLRLMTHVDQGNVVGAEPSMLKLKGSELVQAIDELLFEAVGMWALVADRTISGADTAITPEYAEFVASGRYHHRGFSIAGGTNEVQHNIIAKAVLGL